MKNKIKGLWNVVVAISLLLAFFIYAVIISIPKVCAMLVPKSRHGVIH